MCEIHRQVELLLLWATSEIYILVEYRTISEIEFREIYLHQFDLAFSTRALGRALRGEITR